MEMFSGIFLWIHNGEHFIGVFTPVLLSLLLSGREVRCQSFSSKQAPEASGQIIRESVSFISGFKCALSILIQVKHKHSKQHQNLASKKPCWLQSGCDWKTFYFNCLVVCRMHRHSFSESRWSFSAINLSAHSYQHSGWSAPGQQSWC